MAPLENMPSERQVRPAGIMASLGLADQGMNVHAERISGRLMQIARLWPLVLLTKISIVTLLGMAPVPDDMAHALVLAVMLGADGFIMAAPHIARFRRCRLHVQKWLLLPFVFLSGVSFSLWIEGAHWAWHASTVHALAPELVVVLVVMCVCGDRRLLGIVHASGVLLVTLVQEPVLAQFGFAATVMAALLIVTLRQANEDRREALEQQTLLHNATRSARLLVEYENTERGWFWETDRQGRIVYISQALLRTLDVPRGGLLGRPFTDIVQPCDRQQGDGERTLGFHLSARTPFNEIAVLAAMTDEERWWSISGKPIFTEYGQFHGFRGSGADLTAMRQSQAEVARLAQYDSLTGLPNRMQMLRSLEQAVGCVGGRQAECTLMMLDLDRFKVVNDTLGHPAGDVLLQQVSKRLQHQVGNRGLIGRQGGDEFKILLPGSHDEAALAQLARAIIGAVSQSYMVEGTAVVIGVSIGIAMCPRDGRTTDALIRNADLALYAAKGDGRGVHRFYSANMHSDAEDRRKLEEDLREALACEGLHLVYQPVVSSTTERITGYEALLRWHHPLRGPVSPSLFIPIAEDSGLIHHIGEWALRTACRDAADWPDNVRVAVNVSPSQFANPAFSATVVSALAGSQLPAERLELEITESVYLNDDAGTDAIFKRLKGIGVRLALDDFGTGYSSLGYLKTAPFDKIKIDQSFVRGAAIKGSRNSAIIKAIVGMAEALGMDTTAEGAETRDELDLIRQLGCSHIQGYVYGLPMPAMDVRAQQRATGTMIVAEGYQSSRAPRRTMLRSVAIHHDGYVYTGRIRNLSANGAMIEGLWHVPVGTSFAIELSEHQYVNATVRWSGENRVGVEFAGSVEWSRPQPVFQSQAG